MRIVFTLNDQKQARLLASFLAREGIENQLEIDTNTDWGSPNYGDASCKIWVYDEDKVETAMRWIETFNKDPQNPVFQKAASGISTPPLLSPRTMNPPRGLAQPAAMSESMGRLTFYILLICTLLFIVDNMTAPQLTSLPGSLPAMPIVSSPLKKNTLYDYPHTYELVDKLVKLYGVNKLETPQELPSEGKYLFNQVDRTPYWQGIYPYIVALFQHGQAPSITPAPLFEKIREGEVWRLFTPCLMHNDILHILFNMLWLIVLGKQMEQRLGAQRYLLFILLVGIFSNTCQYLMSGPNFLGYSGILCGMLTFIWMRQKVAVWEGYPLQQSTIAFMMFFIFAMFGLQLISLYMSTQHQLSIFPGIANTAHLSGAALGAILGRLSFFSQKR